MTQQRNTRVGESLLEAALDYAGRGRRVFPVRPDKRPLTPHGFKDATTDEARIREWWAEWPAANIATPTGNGLLVIDVDGDDGSDSLHELEDRYGKLPCTAMVKTPRGMHYWLAYPPGVQHRNTAGQLAPGIDTRAEGGYALLPPSRTKDGSYEWDGSYKIAEVGDWGGLDLLSKNGAAAPSVEGDIPERQRNETLASFAGSMRRRGMSEAAITVALLEENRTRCKPSLKESEVRKIAHSVARYKPAENAIASLTELNGLLGLDEVHKRIDTVKVFGRGMRAAVRFCLDDGNLIVLDPIGAFKTPQNLMSELALRAGASPMLKGSDVQRVFVLIYRLADHYESVETEDRADELGADYLRSAAIGEVDMSDGQQRWDAFWHLERSETKNIILQDPKTGIRYVRIGWFADYVRERGAVADIVLRAMPALGWHKRGSEGRIKATRPGFKDTINLRFFEVDGGWET